MIFDECKFNKLTDICEVDQFGYVNLHDALANGIVPGNIAVDEGAYNGIEDLASIMGKPSDVFEAMQYGVSLNNAAAASSEKEGAE